MGTRSLAGDWKLRGVADDILGVIVALIILASLPYSQPCWASLLGRFLAACYLGIGLTTDAGAAWCGIDIVREALLTATDKAQRRDYPFLIWPLQFV